jgi:hypothetical protein
VTARPLAPLALLLLAAAPATAADATIDLSRAVVVTPSGLTGPETKAVQMLVKEVEKRTLIAWKPAERWVIDDRPVVVVGPAAGVRRLLAVRDMKLPDAPAPAEGYRIGVEVGKAPIVWVAGNDSRGVLFGVGRLLRELRLDRLAVSLPADFHEESAPKTPLRGHQLGYRPKTNSYDGWTVAMWEQYIRDLAVFGCNAIELIPPRSDDDADSPHFSLPPMKMMVEMSRLANEYGLAVWIWYPAMDNDYANLKTVEFALKEWGEVFRALPRIDAVFVPGGDPGHTTPKALFDLLEKQTANLRKYHPKAEMWVSPQGFNRDRFDEFLALVKAEPAWLSGIAHGPQIRADLPEFRKLIPAKYPIRDYPDITHSRHCQYPVPDWDVAFALTCGREGSNPRPTQMAAIYKHARPHTNGFITYSEGCHDDVNKAVWSALGWDDRADVKDILRQYARYFINPKFEERFADGLLGLEKNWVGPALENAGIDKTLDLFREMERQAPPPVKLNWRFQQALYRAYYDATVRNRLRYETDLEATALRKLGDANRLGSLEAMAEAEAFLDRPVFRSETRARTLELAEALFQSIRAQLSVKKYQAIAVERGATLDTLDTPLTDAAWWKAQFAEIRKLPDEAERLAKLKALLNRTDSGPGGSYDAPGDPKQRPHLVRDLLYEKDPAFYSTTFTDFGFRGFGPGASMPRAWWAYASSLYDHPVVLRYPGLDPAAKYRVRVVYGRERPGIKIRLDASGPAEVHSWVSKPLQPLEFDIPVAATDGGTLTLSWTKEPGGGGTGRGCAVAEVWLMKGQAGK